MTCFFALIVFLFGSFAFANCPNLNGFYWNVAADKPYNGTLGRMMEVRQKECESLELYVHWVDSKGRVIYEGTNGQTWDLTEKTCKPYEVSDGIDCRKHTTDANYIFTFGAGSFKSGSHGFCRYTQFAWSRSGKDIVEVRPSTCEDGFSGNITRTFEYAK